MIYSAGKILNDDTALKEYKIDEKNFVVVMVAKVRNQSLIELNTFYSISNKESRAVVCSLQI